MDDAEGSLPAIPMSRMRAQRTVGADLPARAMVAAIAAMQRDIQALAALMVEQHYLVSRLVERLDERDARVVETPALDAAQPFPALGMGPRAGRRGLGRGLEALIPAATPTEVTSTGG